MRGGESRLPGGTEKFILLTDIARSSWLTEAYPQQYYAALKTHNEITERTVAEHGGEVLKSLGDGFLALFDSAANAVAAAVDLQLAISADAAGCLTAFPDGSTLGVRAVVHGGQLTQLAGQDYDWYGPALNRSSRIGKVCHPGQLLISGVVRQALPTLPSELAELDLGPVRLRDLSEPEQLYQLTHPDFAQRQFPPLRDLNSRPNNLLMQPSAFIGRDREMDELSHLLDAGNRLITLHGHGGYGKSRLASQLCAHLLWRYRHGAFQALLAPLRDFRQLPEALAGTIGFKLFGQREPRAQLLDHLRHKELLLCLDNFEHLLDGADFVAEILNTAPNVQMLVTSREPLRLMAEHVYSVGPLPLGPGSDSVMMYADRAARVNHAFTINAETAPWVERICERLEGVPLSIELSAAWADRFTLAQMHTELEQQLELTARMRDVPARQRSVRASCDWSYGLLQPALQRALRRLSIFQNGFFVDAAQAVLELADTELLEVLTALCDKSWLFTREVTWAVAGTTITDLRYFLRDAASQEYALQHLRAADNEKEYARVIRLHAEHYAGLLVREGPSLRGAGRPDSGRGQAMALKRIGLERGNLSLALESALARQEAAWLLPIVKHHWRALDISGSFRTVLDEAARVLRAAQSLDHAELEMHSLLGLARANHSLGDSASARKAATAAGKLADKLEDRDGQAQARMLLANGERREGRFAPAHALIEEALALRRKLEDIHGETRSLYSLGKVASAQGDLDSALTLIGQALALQREIGDRLGEASSLFDLGNIGLMQGDCSSAHALLEQAIQLQQELGDRPGEAQSRSNLGNVAGTLGDFSAARQHFAQALAIQHELGDRPGEAYALVNLAVVERVLDNYGEAWETYQQALQLARENRDTVLESYCLHELGTMAIKQGEHSVARHLLAGALVIRRKIGNPSRISETLVAAGAWLAIADQPAAAAVCLYGARRNAAQLGYTFNPAESELLEHGLSAVEHLATGLATAEREQLQSQAEAMNPAELAQFALDNLEGQQGHHGPGAD